MLPFLINIIILFALATNGFAEDTSRQDGEPAIKIQTYAGGGVGDGGLAVDASLYTPIAIEVDAKGNLYIADSGHHRIRRVDGKTKIITTVAGRGIRGHSGDHGPAIDARLSAPHGIVLDIKGNLYISDTENHSVRMIDKKGNLHPVIGKSPKVSTAQMPKDHKHSQMYMPKEDEAMLVAPPHHISISPQGDLYIAESENNRIVMVDTYTGKLTVIAGGVDASGYAGDGGPATHAALMSPHSMAVDVDNNVYIADTYNHRIRRVNGKTGIITTIAGTGTLGYSGDGGAAVRAKLASPFGIAVSSDGSIYFTDTNNMRIRRLKFVDSNWIIETIAGTGKRGKTGDWGQAREATFIRPAGIAIDLDGNLYIADTGGHQIRKINTSGIITTVAGNGQCCFAGDGLAATDANLNSPYGISQDHSGNLYIADRANHRIRRVDATSGIMTTVAGNGLMGYSGDGGDALKASLRNPTSVAISNEGSIIIADQGNHRIRKVDILTGVISTVVGGSDLILAGGGGSRTDTQLNYPTGIAWEDGIGNIYISDTENHRVLVFEVSTKRIEVMAGTGTFGFSGDGLPATEAEMANPTSLAFDQNGNLYIADTKNHRIRRVDRKTGIINTVAGNGTLVLMGNGGPATEASLRYPSGISINENTLYISDTGHHMIRMVALDTGIMTSLVRNGRAGSEKGSRSFLEVVFGSPRGIFVHSKTLFVADTDNRRIQKITFALTQTP